MIANLFFEPGAACCLLVLLVSIQLFDLLVAFLVYCFLFLLLLLLLLARVMFVVALSLRNFVTAAGVFRGLVLELASRILFAYV